LFKIIINNETFQPKVQKITEFKNQENIVKTSSKNSAENSKNSAKNSKNHKNHKI